MTITEKILARAAGRDTVDARATSSWPTSTWRWPTTSPRRSRSSGSRSSAWTACGTRRRWRSCPSHFVPAKDIASAKLGMAMRDFARAQGIEGFFELGRGGIEHALLPEQAWALPGMVIIGADSHSCTYGGLGAFSTGVGSTDLAAVLATGKIWLRRPGEREVRLRGQARAVGGRQGHDPVGHRARRRRRLRLPGDGAHRPGAAVPVAGLALHADQHGHRGRRQVRHRAARRGRR